MGPRDLDELELLFAARAEFDVALCAVLIHDLAEAARGNVGRAAGATRWRTVT